MENLILNYILNNIGFLLTSVLATGMGLYIFKGMKIIKEVKELLDKTSEILSDNKISNQEITEWIKEAKDIPAAIKDLTKKNN